MSGGKKFDVPPKTLDGDIILCEIFDFDGQWALFAEGHHDLVNFDAALALYRDRVEVEKSEEWPLHFHKTKHAYMLMWRPDDGKEGEVDWLLSETPRDGFWPVTITGFSGGCTDADPA